MKKLEMEIPIPDGLEFDSFDKQAGKIKLKVKLKDILDRIDTDLDVLDDNGYTLESFDKWCEGLSAYERADRFLELLHKSLNEGWEPDFDNSDQWKYQPRFLGGSRGFRSYGFVLWYSYSNVGSRLCLKEARLAIHAGTKFTKWFKASIIK